MYALSGSDFRIWSQMSKVSWAKFLQTHYSEVFAEQHLQRKQSREVSVWPEHWGQGI